MSYTGCIFGVELPAVIYIKLEEVAYVSIVVADRLFAE